MGAQVKAIPGSVGPTLVQTRPFHYTNLFGGPKEVFVQPGLAWLSLGWKGLLFAIHRRS